MHAEPDIIMTLPGNQNVAQEASTGIATKSNSPNGSPQMSSKNNHKNDVSSTSQGNDKSDQEVLCTSGENSIRDKEKKLSDRPKKKAPWYSTFYPSYKSRSETFKRIFKDVIPLEERLIVDYSCALQRDILVHGRLYASQNYLCFYANIFRWETMMTVQWKEVTAITKEKTALIIPNAVLIHTDSEKHFLTSFGARDKTYLMLFRIWQNALMDKSLSMQEIWQWVHACYGDELGLTSDDDDYVPPFNPSLIDDCKNDIQITAKEFIKETELDRKSNMVNQQNEVGESSAQNNNSVAIENGDFELLLENGQHIHKNGSPMSPSSDILSTDITDTTDSDLKDDGIILTCPDTHEGRLMVNIVLPIHVDQLFTTLFTNSEFCRDFHEFRKNTDISYSDWELDSVRNQKLRKVSLVVPINQAVGPKTSQITESQVLLNCSKPGCLYVINIESNNAGIPYADSFYITTHFCISRTANPTKESSLTVYCQIKYRKSVWGLVKTFIEKNCWSGLEEHYAALIKALETEGEKCRLSDSSGISSKRKVIRKRRCLPVKTGISSPPVPTPSTEELSAVPLSIAVPTQASISTRVGGEIFSWTVLTTLIVLLGINGFLYYKLWSLEDFDYKHNKLTSLEYYLQRHSPPNSPEEWLELLHNQEILYHKEINGWHNLIKTSINHLHQAEESLKKLEDSVKDIVSEQILKNLKDSFDKKHGNNNNEKQTEPKNILKSEL